MNKLFILSLLVVMSGLVLPLEAGVAGLKLHNIKGKEEIGMAGIVFLKTQKLQELKEFYINRVGAQMWMDQKDCVIFRFGSFLFGFCQRDKADMDSLLTFFYEKTEGVDKAYALFNKTAISTPSQNKRYPIYHFFCKDPEGRLIEFQAFTCPIDWKF